MVARVASTHESKLAQGLALGTSDYLAVIRGPAVAPKQVFRKDLDICSRKTLLFVPFPFHTSCLWLTVSLFFPPPPFLRPLSALLCVPGLPGKVQEGKLPGSLAG